ncbi:ribosomal protein S18-alanine N-acetyltransferase [Zongyangia hominis]|uniref:Ribosomal protein S18-alanine N-acetyltransferase n=1 Tax=Zongyangia hominis TaxID=2763677 RepID=A0A926E975_9FIRM|nr:ribosomal protein S18-alanine N-acetyltransferase [Zongyangia hominis]MBC8570230.1 ribosomal protein S18-alanine N-acetyltransferase [Zongyangia hominis]
MEAIEGIRIVKMEQRHIREVARLEKECFSTPWRDEGLAYELTNPLAAFYVALDPQDRVAGYAGMHNIVGEGYITNIAVYASCRRRGIGRALLQTLLHFAKEHELRLVTLEVRASNTGAIALYEQMGFDRVGFRPGYYQKPKEDALIMTRRYWSSDLFPEQIHQGDYLNEQRKEETVENISH